MTLPRFKITDDRLDELSWDALIALQKFARGENEDIEGAKEFCTPFVIGEDNDFLEEEDARRVLGRVKRKVLPELLRQFAATLAEYAIPKANGKPSTPLSGDTVQAPDGSTIS